jgi:hypothetical protein
MLSNGSTAIDGFSKTGLGTAVLEKARFSAGHVDARRRSTIFFSVSSPKSSMRWAYIGAVFQTQQFGRLESSAQRHAVMVRYLESCGRASVPTAAVRFARRRLPVSLHSDDFVDGRNIPEAAVDRSGVGCLNGAVDSVRFRRPSGRVCPTPNNDALRSYDKPPMAMLYFVDIEISEDHGFVCLQLSRAGMKRLALRLCRLANTGECCSGPRLSGIYARGHHDRAGQPPSR